MNLNEFQVGMVVCYTEKNKNVIRGIVVDKTYIEVSIMWAVSKWPKPIQYTISDTSFLENMSFYAHWHEFNTVQVKTINSLNKF